MLQEGKDALPAELLVRVLSLLDPRDSSDRQALARVSRCSSSLYDLAMPLLYQELELNDSRLLGLLAGGHFLSSNDTEWKLFTIDDGGDRPKADEIRERWIHLPAPSENWCRSLGQVRSLSLLAPISAKALVLLWDVCIPNKPLFPRVDTLRIQDAPRAPDQPQPEAHDAIPDVYPALDILLFECPDFCGEGLYAAPLLVSLPAKAHRHITFHSDPFCAGRRLQRWQTCRLFDYDAAARLQGRRRGCPCRRHGNREPLSLDKVAMYIDDDVDALSEDGPVDLCLALKEYEYDEEEDEAWNTRRRLKHDEALEDWRTVAELVTELGKKSHNGNLRIVLGDVNDPNPPDCPPCVVCGKSRQQIILTDRTDLGAPREDSLVVV